MNSYKKGEDAATLVAVVILLLLAVVLLWKSNLGATGYDESAASKTHETPGVVRMDRQSTALNVQLHGEIMRSELLSKREDMQKL